MSLFAFSIACILVLCLIWIFASMYVAGLGVRHVDPMPRTWTVKLEQMEEKRSMEIDFRSGLVSVNFKPKRGMYRLPDEAKDFLNGSSSYFPTKEVVKGENPYPELEITYQVVPNPKYLLFLDYPKLTYTITHLKLAYPNK